MKKKVDVAVLWGFYIDFCRGLEPDAKPRFLPNRIKLFGEYVEDLRKSSLRNQTDKKVEK